MKKFKFWLSPGYWLGAFALFLPLFVLILANHLLNPIPTFIVFAISQASYLIAISLIFKEQELEIRDLRKQLKEAKKGI